MGMALVTGTSSGIGAELAKLCAAKSRLLESGLLESRLPRVHAAALAHPKPKRGTG